MENFKPETENSEPHISQEQIETLFGKTLKCFKRWGRLGITIGSIFVAGDFVIKNKEKEEAYCKYVDAETLKNPKSKEIQEVLESKISRIFSEQILQKIKLGDLEAFVQRNSEYTYAAPEMVGIREKGWDYEIDEKYLTYPKGWIRGEVDVIKYIDFKVDTEFNNTPAITGGGFSNKSILNFNNSFIYLFRTEEKKPDTREQYIPVRRGIIEHELGHANDWETDMHLNLTERYTLLLQVYERTVSSHPFEDSNGDHYHESYLNGTQEGLYTSVKECWADMCKEYFTNPREFLKNWPEDFKIVNSVVLKNDPMFDIFDKNRGKYDGQTGEIKEIWKNEK